MWNHQTPPQPEAYPFTAEERARLAAYKAAVEAGFYSDATADPRDQLRITRGEASRLFGSPGWRFVSYPRPAESFD